MCKEKRKETVVAKHSSNGHKGEMECGGGVSVERRGEKRRCFLRGQRRLERENVAILGQNVVIRRKVVG